MPNSKNGKICYLELPATDVERSAAFYSGAFGWQMRRRGDGVQAFDDTTGEVSGAFAKGRRASDSPGMLFYIMVDDIDEACKAVEANGGKIVQPVGADAPEITARFADPAGNVIGLYQQTKQ
jgi:predicted enzyme related to lactoylglutathione lyase